MAARRVEYRMGNVDEGFEVLTRVDIRERGYVIKNVVNESMQELDQKSDKSLCVNRGGEGYRESTITKRCSHGTSLPLFCSLLHIVSGVFEYSDNFCKCPHGFSLLRRGNTYT